MKFNPKALPIASKALFTIVGGAVLINPVFAQEQASEELEEVVVTGLRGSLKASMETKRDAIGVVDAINAEDIGKFPDTNLSESLQRITGISIDRRNGEGSTVTARGFGPQYNMVTLNGRQMPVADAFGGGDAITGGAGGNTRSFNFANLAAEAINAVEVYKTGRADIATGGIGASINVRTARPLDNDGMVINIGAKALNDTTNRVGSDITPEISGIFSYASDNKMFGVGLSASMQKRDFGSSSATVNDWHIQAWDSANMANNISRAPLYAPNNLNPYDDARALQIVNAPAEGQFYGIPNDIRYAFSDSERERTNAQLTLQLAPTDTLTLTADVTFAEQEITEDRGEQTVWLQRNGFDYVEFDTNEAVATPVVLHELTGSGKDFGYEQQHREQKNDLRSIGLNADWAVSEQFKLGVDFHNSRARSLPNDGITGGGETAFSMAGKVPSACNESVLNTNTTDNLFDTLCINSTNFWTQQFQFNNGMPIAGRALYPDQVAALADTARTGGNRDYTFDQSSFGSQVLRIGYQDQVTDIKQGRLDGEFTFENESKLGFGVETRAMESRQRSSGGYMALGDWGVGDAGSVPDLVALLTPFSLTGAFDDFNPIGAPTGGFKGNANVLGAWGVDEYGNWSESSMTDGVLAFNPGYNTNSTIEEDTKALYAQYAMKFELGGRATNLVLGARYEETTVAALNNMLIPYEVSWQDDNDFRVERPSVGSETLVRGDGRYHNFLPNLDFDIALSDTLKGRFSYSKTIARAGYGQLGAGVNPAGPGGSTLNGFTPGGNQNNPGLLPLESDNFDLSLEYYFADQGYVSVAAFQKNVENFIGNSVTNMTMHGIRNQTGGPRAQAAAAALATGGYSLNDSRLFTMMAMMVYEDQGPIQYDSDGDGVTETFQAGAANYNDSDAQHRAFATAYDLHPTADDPLWEFAVSQPVNTEKAKIHGFEFGGQYFFGDTGFGVLANYTIVRGDIGYENTSDPNVNQFALLGLSDSANAVLMFEKFGLSARLAYNWRDEFLQTVNRGQWRNPIYVEAYDQIDLSVGYDINDSLAVSFEAINLTGEDVRWHGRSQKQLWRLEDQGARYALGARYKF
jgi:TonB-dependent receptor